MLLEETATRGRQPGGSEVLARYRLNDLYCSMWLALSISALCRERVFDHISENGDSAADIASRCDLNAPALKRVLRALAANGILYAAGEDRFAHTDVSRLLRWDNPCSWAGMSKMWGHRVALRSWEQFSAALTDGNSGIAHA